MKLLNDIIHFLKIQGPVKTMKAFAFFKNINSEGMVDVSSVPAACGMANMIFDKDYDNAIAYGEQLISNCPNDYFAHCNLMCAYLKKGDIENCNKEAKLAIIKGHHTGFCENRLSINLYRAKKYHQCLQLYAITQNPRFEHSFSDLYKRSQRALKHLNEAVDNENDVLFTSEEVEEIYMNIKRLKQLKEWYIKTRLLLKKKYEEASNEEPFYNEESLKKMQYYTDLLMKLNSKYGYLD